MSAGSNLADIARRFLLAVLGLTFLFGWHGGDARAATGPVYSVETSTRWPQIQLAPGGSGTVGPCYHAEPWGSHGNMKDQCWQPIRDSYVYDPGRGEEIGAAQFASGPMVDYYTSTFNFSRNFLFWAPIDTISVTGRTWYGCIPDPPGDYRVSWTHIEGFCRIDQGQGPPSQDGTIIGHVEARPVSASFGNGSLVAKTYGGQFIATACGNPSTNQRVEGPIPTLGGHTYHDLNRDGIRQGNEPTVGGFQLRLLYGSTVVATATSDANGAYTFALNADNNGPGRFGQGTYTVQRLDRAGWQSIGTAAHSQGVGWASGTSASRSDLDFGAWLPPTISIADASVVEGTGIDAQLIFTVTLGTATGVPIGVDAAAAPGSASAPADFAMKAQRITVPPGATSASFVVDVVADIVDELDETMSVSLSGADFGVQLIDADAIGTIIDDDTAQVTVGPARAVEGDPGDDRHLVHSLTLSAPADRELQVAYSTAGGTATSDVDYINIDGVAVFDPGDTAQSLDVPVLEDLVDELDETYQLVLQAPSIGELAVGSAEGVIEDDDTTLISIADATVVEGDPGGDRHLVHAVSLSTPADRSIVLSHLTAGVTATQDGDYEGVDADLVLPPFTTSATIDVAVIEDLVDELDETYTLTVAAPAVGQLADGVAVGTIVDDDTARVHIEPAVVVEGDPGDDVRLAHHVVLSTPSDRPVTVPYSATPGTAAADVDYESTAGSLRFEPFATDLVVEVPVLEDLLVEGDETYTIALDPSGLVNTEPEGPLATSAGGTILDDDWRQGTMSCRAQGLDLLGTDLWVANPADHPCRPDHEQLLNVNVGSPLLGSLARVQAKAVDAGTEQNFVLPGPVAPADGDRARAAAQITGLRLSIGLLLDLRADVLGSEATVTCAGGTPVLQARSLVTGVRLGLATYNTDRPVTINLLGLGTLRLNWVSNTGTRATARALWLDLPGSLLDVVLGESTADIHDAPCAKGRPFP